VATKRMFAMTAICAPLCFFSLFFHLSDPAFSSSCHCISELRHRAAPAHRERQDHDRQHAHGYRQDQDIRLPGTSRSCLPFLCVCVSWPAHCAMLWWNVRTRTRACHLCCELQYLAAPDFTSVYPLTDFLTTPYIPSPHIPCPSVLGARGQHDEGGGDRGGREGQDAQQVQEDHRPR
jgi:hypothetical protein